MAHCGKKGQNRKDLVTERPLLMTPEHAQKVHDGEKFSGHSRPRCLGTERVRVGVEVPAGDKWLKPVSNGATTRLTQSGHGSTGGPDIIA